MDLELFSLLLQVVFWYSNVKKGHKEFWGNLRRRTAPYITDSIEIQEKYDWKQAGQIIIDMNDDDADA